MFTITVCRYDLLYINLRITCLRVSSNDILCDKSALIVITRVCYLIGQIIDKFTSNNDWILFVNKVFVSGIFDVTQCAHLQYDFLLSRILTAL